jgi:NADPH:quinone reductase-like Zn-dependent oxidoreductase
MRAIRLHAPGGPEQLELDEVETPLPGVGDVLVHVHAASITRDELEWPTDRLPAIPSYELSGVVAVVGAEVGDVAVGDPVYALTGFDRDGAAAEYVLVGEAMLAPKPHSLDHVESAALPLAALSAWQGLIEHGRLVEGQRVLIHGAAGGVGHLATQIARLRGAHVIGTVSPASIESGMTLGADELLVGALDSLAQLEPVDLVFDTVGGQLLARSPELVRPDGRLVSVAEEPPTAPGIHSTYFVVEPNRDQLLELGRLVEGGGLRPLIDSVFPLAEARAAFERSMASGKRGKVVLRVAGD